MSKNNDHILSSELGKLGAKGAGKLGGKLGTRLAAKLLIMDTFEINHDVTNELTFVLRAIMNILNHEGEIIDKQENDSVFEVKALVRLGSQNMNPAIVTVKLNEISSKHTHITIQGIAKEGLIKQHAGEKAARFVAQCLAETLV